MADKEKEIEDYRKEIEAERIKAGFIKFGLVNEEAKKRNLERIRTEQFRRWDWTELKLYLRYDFWKAVDGVAVLAGCCYPYSGEPMLEDDESHASDFPSQYEMCAHRYGQLSGVWERSNHKLEEARKLVLDGNVFELEFSPIYFIEWALSKKLRIDWLDWAIDRGLYTPKQEAETVA